MNFDKVGKAHWFDVVTPFAFGMPTFDLVMILTMTLVMIVVMIESTGMFLALSDITGKKIEQTRPVGRPAHRRPGHADRRHLQYLPVHQLLAERRPGWRHRRQEPLGVRGRRRDHDRARPAAEDGGAGRIGAAPSCSAAPAW